MDNDKARYWARFSASQGAAVAFFKATDDVIKISAGADAITKSAAKDFVRAVEPMLRIDGGREYNSYRDGDLNKLSIEKGAFVLFNFLQSQTLNLYIEPDMTPAYGYAFAQALIDTGFHNEKPADGHEFLVKNITPDFE